MIYRRIEMMNNNIPIHTTTTDIPKIEFNCMNDSTPLILPFPAMKLIQHPVTTIFQFIHPDYVICPACTQAYAIALGIDNNNCIMVGAMPIETPKSAPKVQLAPLGMKVPKAH